MEEALRAGAQDYLAKPVISDELRQAVSLLISAAREAAFEASQAEFAAIQEELAVRLTESDDLREKAKEISLRSTRVKAHIAFLRPGGTRGDFAREWLSVFYRRRA